MCKIFSHWYILLIKNDFTVLKLKGINCWYYVDFNRCVQHLVFYSWNGEGVSYFYNICIKMNTINLYKFLKDTEVTVRIVTKMKVNLTPRCHLPETKLKKNLKVLLSHFTMMFFFFFYNRKLGYTLSVHLLVT